MALFNHYNHILSLCFFFNDNLFWLWSPYASDRIYRKALVFVLITSTSSCLFIVALQLSVEDSSKDSASQSDVSKLLADQSFVSSILASVCL